MRAIDRIVEVAKEELAAGVKESPSGSNKTKYGAEYGMNGQPWCMIFVWWVYNHADCGLSFYNGGKVASCTSLRDWAKVHGQWYTNLNYIHEGDILIMDTVGDGLPHHTGIAIGKPENNYVPTIEGNTSVSSKGSQSNGGAVAQKKRPFSKILGFVRGVPDTLEVESGKEPFEGAYATIELKKGDRHSQVAACKNFLNWFGDYELEIDNYFDDETEDAVKQFQKANNIEVTGVYNISCIALAYKLTQGGE